MFGIKNGKVVYSDKYDGDTKIGSKSTLSAVRFHGKEVGIVVIINDRPYKYKGELGLEELRLLEGKQVSFECDLKTNTVIEVCEDTRYRKPLKLDDEGR